MRSLKEYIIESFDNKFLIKTPEEAKKFLKKKYKESITIQDIIKISDEDIDILYKYSYENNLSAPLVGSYSSNNGIAFRRWFNNDVINKIRNDYDDFFIHFTNAKENFGKNSTIFKGYHNTSLKEDGKYIPTAADFEELICFAYNYICYHIDKIKDNKKYKEKIDQICQLIGIDLNKKNKIVSYYESNSDTLNKMAQKLLEKCPCDKGYKKLKNTINDITNEWESLFKLDNSKPNKTPKTDIISIDGKYRISLKKSGGSQLMSAQTDEAKATLICSVDDVEEKYKDKILDRLISQDMLNIMQDNTKSWKKRNEEIEDIFAMFGQEDLHGKTLTQMKKEDPEIMRRYEESRKKGKNFEVMLNELLKNYPSYKSSFYIEAMSGKHKFGKDSFACANFIFVWNDIKPDKSTIYTPIEYYDLIKNKSKVVVDFKSWPTSNKSGQTLKIIS